MLRTFIVADKKAAGHGIRNVFFNSASLDALRKGGTGYPDDAQIAMTVHEIVNTQEGGMATAYCRG